MARTIVRLAEDQRQNVIFSLDEPRSSVNYSLLLPIRPFAVVDVGGEKVLHIQAHGLRDGQEVAAGAGAGPGDRLPAGLEDRTPYFVKTKGLHHLGLSKDRGGDLAPVYDAGIGQHLLFAWPEDAQVWRLPPVGTGKPLVREAGEMLFRGLVRNRDLVDSFTTAQRNHDPNTICLFFGDVSQRIVEAFPWEAMYHPVEQFLALKQKWPIVRLKDPQASVIESFAYDPPLRIFAVLSATGPFVDPTPEWQGLYQAVSGHDVLVKVMTSEPALIRAINGLNDWRFSATQTLDGDNILNEFRRFAPQVLHLFGHGDGGRVLRFGNLDDLRQGNPGSIQVGAADIRQFSSETVPVWITILNACRSAGATEGPESLTSALARSGFPIVIGMSTDVASTSAQVFTRTYYRSIVALLQSSKEWKFELIDWASQLWETRLAIQAACRAAADVCPQWTVPLFYTRPLPFRLIRIGSHDVNRAGPPSLQTLTRIQSALNSDPNRELGIQGLRALVDR